MENELYRKLIVPTKEAPDGDTPTILYATQEANGYAVFIQGFDGTELVKWFTVGQRNTCIEFAVNEAENRLIERATEAQK